MKLLYSLILLLPYSLILLHPYSLYSQEISYNLSPTHELGDTLWTLPIGGQLTISADGTKMLVASQTDSTFFIVDIKQGTSQRLSARYYQNETDGRSVFIVDDSLSVLVESIEEVNPGFRVWNIESDSILFELDGTHHLVAVSIAQDRLFFNRILLELSTQKEILRFERNPNVTAWFDDARRKMYVSADRTVQEIDPTNGSIIRTWPVRSLQSFVRRPVGSDWIYIFSNWTDDFNPNNWVEAINLVTDERLTFERYFPINVRAMPLVQNVGTNSSIAYSGGYNSQEHAMLLWTFSTEARETRTIADPQFSWQGRPTNKPYAVDPMMEVYLHSWDNDERDSAIIRCHALEPKAVSVGESGTEHSNGLKAWYAAGLLHIEVPNAGVIRSVAVVNLLGEQVLSHKTSGGAGSNRLRLSAGTLPSGSYVCSVRIDGGQESRMITVLR